MIKQKLFENRVRLAKIYFFGVGLFLHVILIFSFLLLGFLIVKSGQPLPYLSEQVSRNLEKNYPSIFQIVSPILLKAQSFKIEAQLSYKVDAYSWEGVGASDYSLYSIKSNTKVVSTTNELMQALDTATSGQTIILSPGNYAFSKSRVNISNAGTHDNPIQLIAEKLGSVTITLKGEGIVIDQPYWQIKNIVFKGQCNNHSDCEHAIHVVGNGRYSLIRNNIFQDFNAAIKINGINKLYPDYGKIIGNTFFNTSIRQTKNPVTPIDLMHANNWIVRENFIYDFIKGKGNRISYGAFFKGGSSNGMFSQNLIMCNANLKSPNIAIGLSIGGGGSPRASHRDSVAFEHDKGVIQNNIIMHCGNDVGIYLNKSKRSLVRNNTIYNTKGIDVRFKESTAIIENNIMSGTVNLRDGGSLIGSLEKNIILNRTWFSASEPLDKFFNAPFNGDFSLSNPQKEFWPSNDVHFQKHVDFCGIDVNKEYYGAASQIQFCKQKTNLKNTKYRFKFNDEKA